jgi:PIN domain nuclease of toxin-antitoxin system
MKYIVDTHALLWYVEGNPRLGENARTILAEPTSQLILPIIALAEAVWIVERGKTSIPSVTILLKAVDADPRLDIYPLDQAIVKQTLSLQEITEMHDRQIVATVLSLSAKGESVALLTRDRNITESGLVPIVW